MGRISEDAIEKILQAADIVSVISRYVELRKRGTNYWGLSPFKLEKTPSFAVNPEKGIYKCFSSGKGGTMISFVMEIENLSYPDALRLIADWYHIEIQNDTDNYAEITEERRQELAMYALNQFAGQFFEAQLQKSEGQRIGLPYWEKRNFTQLTIRSFRLGYAPQETWDALSRAALNNNFTEELLLETGLSLRSEKTGNLIDRFRGRAIFPILTLNGKIAGFSGRILAEETRQAKYINSPESRIYNKSKILYGLYQARTGIKTEGFVILVEGYTDVLSLAQAGIKNAVASGGTALTENHTHLLLRFTHQILIVYDGDEAGIKATIRGGKMLAQKGFSIKVLLLPDGHDPDSFVRLHGGEVTREFIKNNALELVDFVIQSYAQHQDITNPSTRKNLIEELAELIASIKDPLQRALQQQYTAQKMGVSENILEATVNTYSVKSTTPTVKNTPEIDAFKGTSLLEREIIRLLLNYSTQKLDTQQENQSSLKNPPQQIQPTVLEFVRAELSNNTFENTLFERLRKRILFEIDADNQSLSLNRLIDESLQPHATAIVDLLNEKYLVSANWQEKYQITTPTFDHNVSKLLQRTILQLKLHKLKKLRKENNERLKLATTEPEKEDIIARGKELNKLIIQISKELHVNIL